ncbi:Proactivator polypeptide [Hordeum vulgare]|nr:Proactivator polypeptide [Hordeum vulgare]
MLCTTLVQVLAGEHDQRYSHWYLVVRENFKLGKILLLVVAIVLNWCYYLHYFVSVVLDLNTIEIHPNDKEEITSSKIPVSVESGTTVCSTCENLTNKSVSYLSEKQTQDEIMEILHGACSQTFSLEQKVHHFYINSPNATCSKCTL